MMSLQKGDILITICFIDEGKRVWWVSSPVFQNILSISAITQVLQKKHLSLNSLTTSLFSFLRRFLVFFCLLLFLPTFFFVLATFNFSLLLWRSFLFQSCCSLNKPTMSEDTTTVCLKFEGLFRNLHWRSYSVKWRLPEMLWYTKIIRPRHLASVKVEPYILGFRKRE